MLCKGYEDATWLNVEDKSASKCWIQIAPRFDGFRNADESKHITETKKIQHTNIFLAAYHRKTLTLRIRNESYFWKLNKLVHNLLKIKP